MSAIRRMHTSIVGIALTLFLAASAKAQSVVVQQPVVQQFGVNTVVSVPDRGSMLLGSVGSSQTFGRRGGPLSFGSNVSRSVRHSGLSVHVAIHDFEAMEAALLAERQRTTADPVLGDRNALSDSAANACDQLLTQYRQIAPQPAQQRPPITDQAATGSMLSRWDSRSFRNR